MNYGIFLRYEITTNEPMKIQTSTQELGTWNQRNTGTEHKEQGT